MTETLFSLYTENPTETTTPYYTDTMLSNYTSENITESIHNNTLISSINSMVTFQNNLKQQSTTGGTRELPNEILLKIFNNSSDLEDILNLRRVNKKFKSLSEVKLYDIIEEKIKSLESKKKSLERRLSHMKNHLCPRLSHYKVFLNVISRSDVSELCNLPKPPREVKYIFSVLYILYTGGKHCHCSQCQQKKEESYLRCTKTRSNSICCGGMSEKNQKMTKGRSNSICCGGMSEKDQKSRVGQRSSYVSELSSTQPSSSVSSSSVTSMKSRVRRGSVQSDLGGAAPTVSTLDASAKTTRANRSQSLSHPISPTKESEEEIEIPDWEEVRQIINKSDFRHWVMTLHSKLDTVPKEHILLANLLLNKPRAPSNSKTPSTTGSGSTASQSEYENLRLTYDRMLIVSQIGYKILLFIEAIIQSFFLTERFEEQKNNISQVYQQIHQWKDLQLQCKN
ncbi:hypothetical protein BCR36DRAFT_364669 [Piromyces finnis]|uniref:F-box domain-containing protein n=1 Tax=Piromyces finnis TaxID=1754191 RepID=A0A1Y1USH0_9FUNG|nr:hypothetical protein BCR36DRAFT_364669 [Piromyces finnis]|eukprot:ORX40386.1 hypothetical protein BCR36DRAFT_364669 [Piromyces finnis]